MHGSCVLNRRTNTTAMKQQETATVVMKQKTRHHCRPKITLNLASLFCFVFCNTYQQITELSQTQIRANNEASYGDQSVSVCFLVCVHWSSQWACGAALPLHTHTHTHTLEAAEIFKISSCPLLVQGCKALVFQGCNVLLLLSGEHTLAAYGKCLCALRVF